MSQYECMSVSMSQYEYDCRCQCGRSLSLGFTASLNISPCLSLSTRLDVIIVDIGILCFATNLSGGL